MAVLLIGSTGSGKSTLGNFLIDPDDSSSTPAFAVATDNKPMTKSTKVADVPITATRDIENFTGEKALVIIDTPGLNESKSEDLLHMKDIIERLNKVKRIKACVFVVKFSAKIDQQYKDTIDYYSQLLPDLFKSNVLVVVTDYQTDKRSEAMRKRQRINVEEIKANIKAEIVATAKMHYSPILFPIDCLPFDEAEKLVSLEMRNAILSHIFAQPDIMVESLKVAKTKAIKEDDEKKKMMLRGIIEAYSSELEKANKTASAVLNEIKEKQERIANIEMNLVSPKQHLKDLDVDDAVVSNFASSDHDSKNWYTYLYTNFDLESEWDIIRVEWWKFHRHNKWKRCSETRRRVTARLEGVYGGALHASITLYTKKKWMYESEIDQLKSEISQMESDLRLAKSEAKHCQERNQEHRDAIANLVGFMKKTNRDIEKIAADSMTIEEAESRINSMTTEAQC